VIPSMIETYGFPRRAMDQLSANSSLKNANAVDLPSLRSRTSSAVSIGYESYMGTQCRISLTLDVASGTERSLTASPNDQLAQVGFSPVLTVSALPLAPVPQSAHLDFVGERRDHLMVEGIELLGAVQLVDAGVGLGRVKDGRLLYQPTWSAKTHRVLTSSGAAGPLIEADTEGVEERCLEMVLSLEAALRFLEEEAMDLLIADIGCGIGGFARREKGMRV
jgi:hypothetical protein